MAVVETVTIVRDGNPVVINKSDMTDKDKLYTPKAPKVKKKSK